MSGQIDWLSIEGVYRAGRDSLRDIASAHGITEGAIRKRAKREGWTRDPSGTKRERVRAAMSGGTQKGTQCVLEVMKSEADQDIADMRRGVDVARRCLMRLSVLVDQSDSAREIKVIAEAVKLSVDTIRKIRGLDDEAGAAAAAVGSKVLQVVGVESASRMPH